MGKIYDLAIIGGGGAGQMAILRAALNQIPSIAFLGDTQARKRSRSVWVHDVENIPGMFDIRNPITQTEKSVLKFIEARPELAACMETHQESVTKISRDRDIFTLTAADSTYQAKYVVLCTGTADVQPHIQGKIDPVFPYANRGDLLYCIRCDGHKTIGHDTAVIGHSTGAAWVAIMLKERYDNPKITLLSNGRPFEGSMEVRQILDHYGIEVIEEPIQEILGDPKEAMSGFQLEGQKVAATRAFVALGSIVHNDLARQLGVDLDDREHIKTNAKCETNVPGFYAVGDLVSGKKKQVYTAWDMAVDAVDDIDAKLRAARREAGMKKT